MKLSGIALLFLSLTTIPPPTFAPIPLKCSQRLSNPVIAFQQLGQLKNLSSYTAITAAWADVRLLFTGDGMVPISTELKTALSSLFWLCTGKNKLLVCVCMRAHMWERKSVCLFVGTHKCGGKSNLLLFSTAIPEVKPTKTATFHLLWETAKERRGNTDSFLARTITAWMKSSWKYDGVKESLGYPKNPYKEDYTVK